ncbi:hypothetical protein Vretimale_19507, partial [Volvox reticuliferus]
MPAMTRWTYKCFQESPSKQRQATVAAGESDCRCLEIGKRDIWSASRVHSDRPRLAGNELYAADHDLLAESGGLGGSGGGGGGLDGSGGGHGRRRKWWDGGVDGGDGGLGPS